MSTLSSAARIELKYGDIAGIVVSTLCAIHCAAVPLLLATAAASGLTWLYEEGLDWAFLATSSAIGFASLLPAYRRLHRRKTCLALFVGGILCILAGRLAPEGLPDTPFVVFGAVLIISGHAVNQYFCRSCRKCSSEISGNSTVGTRTVV
jgi:hypothetical protein